MSFHLKSPMISVLSTYYRSGTGWLAPSTPSVCAAADTIGYSLVLYLLDTDPYTFTITFCCNHCLKSWPVVSLPFCPFDSPYSNRLQPFVFNILNMQIIPTGFTSQLKQIGVLWARHKKWLSCSTLCWLELCCVPVLGATFHESKGQTEESREEQQKWWKF